MTKAEKRSFTLFVMRNQSKSNILFLRLFEEINRQGRYDEDEIIKNIEGVKKRQLSNLKAHLYKQILLSLRMLHRELPDFGIRESLDNARVLYHKGLYKQSLEVLAKAKERAERYHQYELLLILVNEEKRIESQHITNAASDRVSQLIEESTLYSIVLDRQRLLSDLSLELYQRYLSHGYIKNKEQAEDLIELFQKALPWKEGVQDLSFYEALYLYQSYCWYYYMLQDFPNYYRYTQKWKNLFSEYPDMHEVERPIFLKSIHNTLVALFMAQSYTKFDEVFEQLAASLEEVSKPSWNETGLYHLYYYTHLLNGKMMKGDFLGAIAHVEELQRLIADNPYNWDEYRLMVFYYKIASVYFGAGAYGRSIDYLNKIINQKSSYIRTDIQCFSRILSLIAHYELGNRKLIEYQVKSVYRFLSKMGELQGVQQAVFRFVRQIPKISTTQVQEKFRELREDLEEVSSSPFENRAFLYLDIVGWLDAKLQNRTVADVITARYQEKVAGSKMASR